MQSFGWPTCISKFVNVVIWMVNLYIQMGNAVWMVPMVLFQGYLERKVYTRGFFSHDHDINQNRTRVSGTERQRFAILIHRLCVQHSLCMMFVPQEHWTLNFAIQSYRSWPFKQHCTFGYTSWPSKWLLLRLDIEVDHSNKEIASMTNHPNVISISQISKEGFGTYHPPYKAVWKIENKYFNSSSA